MTNDPKAELEKGSMILEPALAPYGFTFAFQGAGHGSGGNFAWGNYERDDRSLHLHHRWGLGIIEYHIGDLWIDHSAYLKFLGLERQSEVLSLPFESGVERYRALRLDLERFCGDFVFGPAIKWVAAANAEVQRRNARSEQEQARCAGDNQKREQARELFREKRYPEAVGLLESLRYPNLLTHSEEVMLQIARDRMGSVQL